MHCRITKSFSFDAAHRLPQVPADHKCHRMHGHTYTVILGLEGEIDPQLGWVQDYAEVAAAFRPLLRDLDHRCLNDIEGLENPTAEILAAWIHSKLADALPLLVDVTVCETPGTSAVYRP